MKGLSAACGAARGTSTESRLRDLNGRLSSNAIASCLDVGRKHERVSKLHCRRLRYWKREQIADGLHCRALPSAQIALVGKAMNFWLRFLLVLSAL